ncbi:hypothetical protein [Sulfurimonas sp. C5]|uniref:hypothetical protein n=1 Tax=Sulfurimonas sp. C5 TaxID=3036947 RepID=UPI002455644C|nr:hypothetical protein [Sulfurimonas sp. C5]MDH4943522.1 hypothetical protein [Sulfurimonas sp. C5]
MKPKIDQNEFDKFMCIFEKEADKELMVDEYVSYQQREAIRTYGYFLVLVGEENYQKVASKLATELKFYNFICEDRIAEMPNDTKVEREKYLKIATKFRNTLVKPGKPREDGRGNQKKINDYIELVRLIDLYIEDLHEPEPNHWQILPFDNFIKKYKKSKTKMKDCINEIIKQYNITGFSKEAKQLIDYLDDLPK